MSTYLVEPGGTRSSKHKTIKNKQEKKYKNMESSSSLLCYVVNTHARKYPRKSMGWIET